MYLDEVSVNEHLRLHLIITASFFLERERGLCLFLRKKTAANFLLLHTGPFPEFGLRTIMPSVVQYDAMSTEPITVQWAQFFQLIPRQMFSFFLKGNRQMFTFFLRGREIFGECYESLRLLTVKPSHKVQ